MMKIIQKYEGIMTDTYEKRIYFKGYITPETIQDTIHSGFGMSYEKLGKILIEELTGERTN